MASKYVVAQRRNAVFASAPPGRGLPKSPTDAFGNALGQGFADEIQASAAASEKYALVPRGQTGLRLSVGAAEAWGLNGDTAIWNQGGLAVAAHGPASEDKFKGFSVDQRRAYSKVLAQGRDIGEAMSVAAMVGIGQRVDAYAANLSKYNLADAKALQRVAVMNDMRMAADSYLDQSIVELLPPGVSRVEERRAAALSRGERYADCATGFASALYVNRNTGHYTLAF